MQDELTYARLNARRKDNKDTYPDILRLRTRRCTSWLGRAEQEMASRDYDAAFIFYWIAFNAAYAEGGAEVFVTRDGKGETEERETYLDKIIALDGEGTVYDALWMHSDTQFNIHIRFGSLYGLRNQLIHGGTTWNDLGNHQQVENGARNMASLVPLFIKLMMDNSDADWGTAYYPLVKEGTPVSRPRMTTWDERTYESLEAKRTANRDNSPGILRLRAQRCISWVGRAEREMGKDCPDYDAAFIFYWIAFNAAYTEGRADVFVTRGGRGEKEKREAYFDKIIALDTERTVSDAISDAIWMRFEDAIRALLENKFVFQPFWNHLNGLPEDEPWESLFQSDVSIVYRALLAKRATLILRKLFERLYVLRNQLVHGGATWKGSVNRAQVEVGARIMAFLVPPFIELMMHNPRADWGSRLLLLS